MTEPTPATCPGCGDPTTYAGTLLGDLRARPCNDDCSIRMIMDWWEQRGFRATAEKEKYSGSYITTTGNVSSFNGMGLRLREVIAPDGQVYKF